MFGRKTDPRLMDFLLQQIASEAVGNGLLVVAKHGRGNFQFPGIRLHVWVYGSLKGHILQKPHYGVSIVPADTHRPWSTLSPTAHTFVKLQTALFRGIACKPNLKM